MSTGLVVAGLPLPEMIVQIDAEAAIAATPPQVTRPYDFDSWHGQGFSWRGATVLGTPEEFFVRGQTGTPLDHSTVPRAAGHLPMRPRRPSLRWRISRHCWRRLERSARTSARSRSTSVIAPYRSAVYPVIGKSLRATRPVSTGHHHRCILSSRSFVRARSLGPAQTRRPAASAHSPIPIQRGAIRPSRPAARSRVSAWRSLPATA